MRKPIEDIELEAVSGGAVILSAPLGVVGFNTTGEIFKIKGDPKEMRDLLNDLYDANENMSDAAFDQLVKKEFYDRGWI